MNPIQAIFTRVLVAGILLAGIVVPVIGQGRGIRVINPITIQCEGSPGQCPCPGC